MATANGKPRKRYKHTTVRQWGGDDGYCWAVFIKGNNDSPIVCGLMRSQVTYYRDKIEKDHEERLQRVANKEREDYLSDGSPNG